VAPLYPQAGGGCKPGRPHDHSGMSDGASPPDDVTVGLVETDADLEGVLALQRKYLRGVQPLEAEQRGGFLTLQHTLDSLRAMHEQV
jgi:hypothetical protein